MQVTLLKNADGSFFRAIQESLKWATTTYIGAAYGSYGAFKALGKPLENFLRNNGKLRALFDIEEFITEKRLIEELATIPGDSECKVFIRPKKSHEDIQGHYHPKFYLFHDNDSYCVIIGSSNFTLGGLKNNIECNLSLANKLDDLFKTFSGFFDELWTSEYSINVIGHQELLDAYQEGFLRGSKEEHARKDKLQKLRIKLDKQVSNIIQARRDIFNPEFAYLLGLMNANGRLDLKKRVLTIHLKRGVANRGTSYEGYYHNPDISDYRISQYEAHKRDVERITENLNLLLLHLGSTADQIKTEHVKDYHFRIILEFGKNSSVLQEIERQNIPTIRNRVNPSVPNWIQKSNNPKIISSFIKGYCDLKSRMSHSDGIYKTYGQQKVYSALRMGISVPHNAVDFLKDFAAMLAKIGIHEGVSVTDPARRSRENLIRIDVRNVPYELIGTHWRRIFLKDFVSYIGSRKNEPSG